MLVGGLGGQEAVEGAAAAHHAVMQGHKQAAGQARAGSLTRAAYQDSNPATDILIFRIFDNFLLGGILLSLG